MSKQEYLSFLRMYLSGRIAPNEVEEHLQYYENYINSHIRMGETEDAVMKRLGDPALIAKSIVSASEARDESQERGYADSEKNSREKKGWNFIWNLQELPRWAKICCNIFIVLLGIGVIRLFLAALPLLIVIAVVIFVVRFVRENL